VAEPPAEPVDVIYLCFPNNPTGAVATRAQLEAWVAYARKHHAIILFDAAYEAYIGDRRCRIPLRNPRRAGVRDRVPQLLEERRFHRHALRVHRGAEDAAGLDRKRRAKVTASALARRHTTKFNGVSYIVQRGAEALYSAEGKEQVAALIANYMGNARILREAAAAAACACMAA